MFSRPNPNSPVAILASWLAALCGGIITLGLIAGGQGLGSIFGGCRWIGVTLPLHQQTWALVNQPTLAFSTQGPSVGYWLGGIGACLLTAVLIVPLVPRPRGLTSEFVILQISWMASVLGLGWMALLDPWDGHLSRFLRLHDVSPAAAWLVPVLGAWASLIPTVRLLALARGAQPQLTRSGRILTVITHLVLPSFAWIVTGVIIVTRTGSTFHGSPLEGLGSFGVLWPPVVAAALPSIAALMMAWLAFPRPWVNHLEPTCLKTTVFLMVAATVLVGLQLILGAPSSGGTCRGVLWSHADSRNNLRSWVNPMSVLGAAVLPSVNDDDTGRE